jgi:predicted DNA binding CopG/RHH family protein
MALSLKKPSKERNERKTKKAAAKLGDGEKRVVADVPEHIHRQVRIRCLTRGILVRDYILELLAKDGVK